MLESIKNDQIEIAVDLGLGGSITYLARIGGPNLVNSADLGRQIQMSHYSGPVPFEPNGKKPKPEWAGLGWNPIQSGDVFGHHARILEHHNDGKELYVKCIPMHWPLNNEPGECTYETWIRLEGRAVHVRSRMVNARPDHTQYTGRDQELPAVYTNGPWWKLMTYSGDQPFTRGALTSMPAKMPWSGWLATEHWAALVDDSGFGLGIMNPEAGQFIGGFAGQTGKGGPHDNPTGYIAPVLQEILDYNITYEYRYDLIVGSLAEIRDYVYAHSPRPSPPRYDFARDRQHWLYLNASDAGWPIHGALEVKMEQEDPQLLGPSGFWRADQAGLAVIDAAITTREKEARLYWSRSDSEGFADARSVSFPIVGDGKRRHYAVDLSASREYRGIITRLRFDPIAAGRAGDRMTLRSISLGPWR